MNIKTLITTIALVTGISASSAMADVRISGNASVELSTGFSTGTQVRDHRAPRYTTPRPIYVHEPAPIVVRDHRGEWRRPHRRPFWAPSYYQTPSYNGWFTLASSLRDGKEIMLDGRYSRLDTVLVQGLDAMVTIGSVTIDYMDGTRKIIGVSKQISRGQSITVQFDGAVPVRRIRVAVSGGGQGSYAVYAH